MNKEERKLLFGSHLMIKDTAYLIVEAELYANNDPYTHRDKQQYQNRTFYFHRINGKGFKEGSFKGMDITFGNGSEARAYLIRAIRPVDGGTIIEGPCLVVQAILKEFGHTTVKEFHCDYHATNHSLSIFDEKSGLYLKKDARNVPDNISASPRVGLKFKLFPSRTPETVLRFCMGPYRYATEPTKLKKQSSTIKMSRSISAYRTERDSGGAIAPANLHAATKAWKVADIAKCYGCYEKLM